MNDERLQTTGQVRQFLEGSEAVALRDLAAKEKDYRIEEENARLKRIAAQQALGYVTLLKFLEQQNEYSRKEVMCY